MSEDQNSDSAPESIMLPVTSDETSGTEKKIRSSAGVSVTESGTTFSFAQKIEQQVTLTAEQMDMFSKAVGFVVKDEVRKAQEPLQERISKLEALVSISDITPLAESGAKLVDQDAVWIATHQQELQKYAGLYVAIADGRIIGSGTSPAEARKVAKQSSPEANPVITRVSKSDFGL